MSLGDSSSAIGMVPLTALINTSPLFSNAAMDLPALLKVSANLNL
jgi:hypothetical protein